MNRDLRNIHPKAKIGKNVTIAPFATIEEDVVIGDNCNIGPNTCIQNGTRIGTEVRDVGAPSGAGWSFGRTCRDGALAL